LFEQEKNIMDKLETLGKLEVMGKAVCGAEVMKQSFAQIMKHHGEERKKELEMPAQILEEHGKERKQEFSKLNQLKKEIDQHSI